MFGSYDTMWKDVTCTTLRVCQIVRRRHASASHRRDLSPPSPTQRYTETQDPSGCILFLLPCMHVLLRSCAAVPACLLHCLLRAPGARRCSVPSSCVQPTPRRYGLPPAASLLSLPGGTHTCTGAPIHASTPERPRSPTPERSRSPTPERPRSPIHMHGGTHSWTRHPSMHQHLSVLASPHLSVLAPQHLSGLAPQYLSVHATNLCHHLR